MEQIWTVAALWIGMALSRGTGLKREGPHGKAPGRPGRCSSAPARTLLGVHSENYAGGDAGASWWDGGAVRLPRYVYLCF